MEHTPTNEEDAGRPFDALEDDLRLGPFHEDSTSRPDLGQKHFIKYREREAFVTHMPLHAQVIAEFEDVAGNL